MKLCYVVFSGTKLFLTWCVVTVVVIYVIDTFLFARLRDPSTIDGELRCFTVGLFVTRFKMQADEDPLDCR